MIPPWDQIDTSRIRVESVPFRIILIGGEPHKIYDPDGNDDDQSVILKFLMEQQEERILVDIGKSTMVMASIIQGLGDTLPEETVIRFMRQNSIIGPRFIGVDDITREIVYASQRFTGENKGHVPREWYTRQGIWVNSECEYLGNEL